MVEACARNGRAEPEHRDITTAQYHDKVGGLWRMKKDLEFATVLSWMVYPSLPNVENGIRVSVGNKNDQGTVK